MSSNNVQPPANVAGNDRDAARPAIDAPIMMDEVCRLMRRAADALEAVMAAIPAPMAATVLPLAHPARTTRQYTHTDWPRPLPRDEEPSASDLFDSAEFNERYQPGFGVEIYFGAGEGYKRVSQTLCLPFYKVGTTALYGLKERFRQHKAEKHGSFWCDNGVYVEDKDFQDQFPSYIRTELQLSSNSPVRATRNSIVVVLPLGMSQLEFEYELQRALAHCAVHRFLQSDDGLRHCRLINVDPQVGIRMTGYGFGAGRRMSPADEIYTIRPHRDGDAMLTIAERIILRHLKLID
ncbi:MAG: hypothetical protein U1E28_01355 [Beijerinckiaceae bacterium]